MNISYTKKGDFLLLDLILENKKQYIYRQIRIIKIKLY